MPGARRTRSRALPLACWPRGYHRAQGRVVDCLKRHRYGVTPQECIDMTVHVVRLLGDGIAQPE